MPFFQNPTNFSTNGCTFNDVSGGHNTFQYAQSAPSEASEQGNPVKHAQGRTTGSRNQLYTKGQGANATVGQDSTTTTPTNGPQPTHVTSPPVAPIRPSSIATESSTPSTPSTQQPVGPQLSPPWHHSQISVHSAPANVQQVQTNQSTTRPHAPHSNNLVSQQSVSPPADDKARPSINPLQGNNVTESSQAACMMSDTTLINGPQPTHITSPSIDSAPPTNTATELPTSPPVVTQAEITKPPPDLECPNLSKHGGTDSPSETGGPVKEDRKKRKKKRKIIFSILKLWRKKA